jgi:CRP-like cAMP-binding protein
MPATPSSPNRILSRLSRNDLALLAPSLTPVDLPVRMQLAAPTKRINQLYFIESGFASVLARGSDKRPIEIGLIGAEGVTGIGVVMDYDRSAVETFIQAAGSGQRISAANIRRADQQSPTLHRALMRYAHSFLVQVTQTALANGRCTTQARLARWLLMAADRLGSYQVPLTHEFLAIMLGTQRPGVTIALRALECDGLIEAKRGMTTILDRKALAARSNGTYTRLED